MISTCPQARPVEGDMMAAKSGLYSSLVSEAVCGGSTRYIVPRQARNKQGRGQTIVNV